MPSNAQFAAQLLRSAAGFFREVAMQNPAIKDQMDLNAQSYETVAELVESDPHGEAPVADGSSA